MRAESDIARNPDDSADVAVATAGAIPRVPILTALLFSVANLGASMVFMFFNFAMPQYLDSYHLNPALIGLLANERSFIGGFIQPLVGRLSDRTHTRFGRRRPFFLAGVPLTALSLLALGLHPPFAVMIAIVPVAGFFLFIAFDPYLAMMADITPPPQRGQVGAFLAVAAMLGAIIFNVAAGFLWAAHESAVFLLTAVVLVIAFGVTFVAVREPARPSAAPAGSAGVAPVPVATTATTGDGRARDGVPAGSRRSQRVRGDGVPARCRRSQRVRGDDGPTRCRRSQGVRGDDGPARRRRFQRVRGYLRDLRRYPVLARYVVALGLFYLGAGGATPFVTLFAIKTLGVPAGQAFFLLIVLVLCTALGAVPAGLLADRAGKKPVLIAGLALFSLGTLAGSQAPSVAWEIPAMVLIGLGNACPTALAVPLLADLSPAERMGEFIGLGSFVWSIAQPAGSFCAGLLVTSALPSTYRYAFIWAGVLIACAAVAMLAVRPDHGPRARAVRP